MNAVSIDAPIAAPSPLPAMVRQALKQRGIVNKAFAIERAITATIVEHHVDPKDPAVSEALVQCQRLYGMIPFNPRQWVRRAERSGYVVGLLRYIDADYFWLGEPNEPLEYADERRLLMPLRAGDGVGVRNRRHLGDYLRTSRRHCTVVPFASPDRPDRLQQSTGAVQMAGEAA